MLELWETHKKFILIVGGSAAVMLLFVWYTLAGLEAAQAQSKRNADKEKSITRDITTLVDEESVNKSRHRKLADEELKKILGLIRFTEDLGPMGDEGPDIFFDETITTSANDLLQKARKSGLVLPKQWTSSGRAMSSNWGLSLFKKKTPESIHEMRMRISLTRRVVEKAVEAGLAKLSGISHRKANFRHVTKKGRIIRRIPMRVDVEGSPGAMFEFLTSLQTAGLYLQLSNAKLSTAAAEGKVKATIEFSALEYAKPSKPRPRPRTTRGRGRTKKWRDSDL